jgi:hypothetical protein
MTNFRKLAVTALFVSALAGGFALGCGGGGASIASACAHSCDCLIEAGIITEADRAMCESTCRSEAEMDNPSQACIDCVDGATCAELTGGTVCETECEEPVDAGASPRTTFVERVRARAAQ